MYAVRIRAVGRLALTALAALTLSGCGGGGGGDESSSAGSISVALEQSEGSGETGTATLTPADDKSFFLAIRMDPGSDTSQLAHIHNVTCEGYARLKDFTAQLNSVSYSLNDLKANASRTKVSVPLDSQTTGENSINVHNSGGQVVACGDIPER
jgi:hypothetical protein